jgi:pyruvate dehydrogenase E1 component
MTQEAADPQSSPSMDREALEWQEAIASVIAFEGLASGRRPARQDRRDRATGRRETPIRGTYGVPQHHSAAGGAAGILATARSSTASAASIRWNAARAGSQGQQETSSELGGHICRAIQSAATLYETGFSIISGAQRPMEHDGDIVMIQGHSSPGIYARAFLEGRLTEDQLLKFRQEVGGGGLSSYPHPWLMPDFWQFPTVSMGLGPLMAIYQARFLKYLHARGLADTEGRKVWVFCGDGEMDEPESLGAISLAGPRTARQPDLRHQLQPAAPRRPGARQRQDHPGARSQLSAAPAGTSSRCIWGSQLG